MLASDAPKLHGLTPTLCVVDELQDWPALATLVALEQELIAHSTADDDEWIDRAAAVKTCRDYFTWARAEQAKLN